MKNLVRLLFRVDSPLQITSACVTIATALIAGALNNPYIFFASIIIFLVVYSIVITRRLLSVAPIAGLLGRESDLVEEDNSATVDMNPADKSYTLTFVKTLRNISQEPVSRVLFWVFANRFPDDPEAGIRFYSANPLTWSDVKLQAWDETGANPGALDIELVNDLNARKDFYIHFREKVTGVPRPIQPRESRRVRYSYIVPMSHWGPYLDRPVLHRTGSLQVTVTAPDDLPIVVGGTEITPLREPRSLRETMVQHRRGNRIEWVWQRAEPPVGSTFRIQWSDPAPPQLAPP